jgi:hypothetical protein
LDERRGPRSRIIIERDPSDDIVSFTQQGGTSQDVCELLA